MRRIGLTASEEMSFENVDRRTDDRRIPSYTISSPMSLRLRWTKNQQNNPKPQHKDDVKQKTISKGVVHIIGENETQFKATFNYKANQRTNGPVKRSPDIWANRKIKFGSKWPNHFWEKPVLIFKCKWPLGQAQEMTLTFNTYILHYLNLNQQFSLFPIEKPMLPNLTLP